MNTNKKNIILEQSLALFFNYGIQHITMDDIAEKCGMSKKTIYKFFESKSDLLSHIIKEQVREFKNNLIKFNKKSTNSLEELNYFFENINDILQTISPIFGEELKKYHPNNYIEIFKYKNTIILPFITNNIKKGQQEGLYKSNLDAGKICESFDNISKVVFINYFSFNSGGTNKKSINFLNSLFLYRLVSLKGLEELNKINPKINNNNPLKIIKK